MTLATAIILAAGLGTRMRPLTETMPKPLIPVQGKALIDWCFDWLEAGGITRAIVNTSYRAQQLEDHLALRSTPSISFSREEPAPFETGGGILHALPKLGPEPFLAMNSDAIFPPSSPHPIARLAEAWRDDVDFVMLVVPRSSVIGSSEKGDFILDDAGRIRRPKAGESAEYIFTGVEIIHPRVFADCPQGPFSLSLLWRRSEQADGWHSRIRAVVHEGPWLNVGDLEGLKAAEAYGLATGIRT